MLIAIGVSPFIQFAFATSGQWGSSVAAATWDYDLYRVERLSFGKTVKGPFEFHNGVFMTEQAKSCKYPDACQVIDLNMLKNGQAMPLVDVHPRMVSAFWHSAQDGRFVYFVPSLDKAFWGTVFEYDEQTATVKTLHKIERKANDLNYVTSAVDDSRVYTTILHKDKNTGNVETKLVVVDTKSGYVRDDITWTLSSRWQEILDVRDSIVLLKVNFDGGYKELLLVDEKARTIQTVPETWTAPDSDIVAGRLLENGRVQYFKNHRMFTYTPGDAKPVESGGAFLNWFLPTEQAVQIAGERLAYVDPENILYVTGPTGVSSFGKVAHGSFTLEDDAIYFESLEGPIGYTFSTKTWKTSHFRVTDSYDDILVGLDRDGNVWYENLTTGKTVNVGYGTGPVLSDREHALWKGTDGHVYQVTFSPLLDLGHADVQAYKAFGSNTVYLKSGQKMWSVPDEATYFSWFDSWNAVIEISDPTLKVYKEGHTFLGDAPFAPGTRVKAVGNPRVYVSGTDGGLHWIVSETVADSIYGSSWNQGIIEVRPERLWNYPMGSFVESSHSVTLI